MYHTGLEIDEVLARYAPLGNRTLLTDALMSVIAQANDDETVSNFYAYSPYGETTVLGPDEGNPLQYTGRENDGTGLYYYRARYYDPWLKRFVSEDPIGIAGGIGLYAYVQGDPVRFADPSGQDAREDFSECMQRCQERPSDPCPVPGFGEDRKPRSSTMCFLECTGISGAARDVARSATGFAQSMTGAPPPVRVPPGGGRRQ